MGELREITSVEYKKDLLKWLHLFDPKTTELKMFGKIDPISHSAKFEIEFSRRKTNQDPPCDEL